MCLTQEEEEEIERKKGGAERQRRKRRKEGKKERGKGLEDCYWSRRSLKDFQMWVCPALCLREHERDRERETKGENDIEKPKKTEREKR